MKRIDFTIRQQGKYSKWCYYKGFDGEKHRWTRKLREADLFIDAIEAFRFKDKLKFNYPRVIAVVRNGSDKIIRTFKPTRKKYCIEQP